MPGLRGTPNTDDHCTYLSDVKKESWSYPAKGNLITVWQFMKELAGCKDAEKRHHADKTLRDKGMPRIPQDSTPKGGKRELIKACYVMWVLGSIEGEVIDAKHPNYGLDWIIGWFDIVSPASMKKVEKNGHITVQGKVISRKANYRYCPLCLYASQNHRTLNNHIRMHFHTSMACGMKDCWFISHSTDTMWKHATSHGLHTAKPIAVNPKKK